MSTAGRYHLDVALIASRSELEAMAEPKLPLTADKHRMLKGWIFQFMGKAQLKTFLELQYHNCL